MLLGLEGEERGKGTGKRVVGREMWDRVERGG